MIWMSIAEMKGLFVERTYMVKINSIYHFARKFEIMKTLVYK